MSLQIDANYRGILNMRGDSPLQHKLKPFLKFLLILPKKHREQEVGANEHDWRIAVFSVHSAENANCETSGGREACVP